MFIICCQYGEFTSAQCAFYAKNEMLYTKHIIVFYLGNNFTTVLPGAALTLHLYYRKTVPSGEDNNRIIS